MSGAGGGGLVMEPTVSNPPSDLLWLAVRFEENQASGPNDARAGAAWIYEPTRQVNIIDCAFINNVLDTDSGTSGGGGDLTIRHAFECASLECEGDPFPPDQSCEPCAPPCNPEDVTFANVINTLLVGNDARGGSGGAAKINRPTNFINCTIAGNTTDQTT